MSVLALWIRSKVEGKHMLLTSKQAHRIALPYIHFNHLPSNMVAHIWKYAKSVAVMTLDATPLF